MKTITAIIAAVLFSILFYEKSIGLNFLIFSLITIISLSTVDLNGFIKRKNLLLSSAYLVSGVLVFLNNSSLSIFTNCTLFFVLIGSFSEKNTSLYVNLLNGFYATIAGYFHRKLNYQNKEGDNQWFDKIDKWHLVKLVGIPVVVSIIFILFYKNGNPFFSDIIDQINLNFIDFQWLLFTTLGFYLYINILNPQKIEPLTKMDLDTGNSLSVPKSISVDALLKEAQLGTTLMLLLNILLLFYIITDILYLLSIENFSASALSDQVHNGIYTLIASIVCAIIIILYFFRGNLNFYKKNKVLKNLSYGWIFLNIVLVFLIVIKNSQYVDSFGLTYKRIGVYIYLFLTLVGLATTFIKVFKLKNLWYLFRANIKIAFGLLFICSFINWDFQITKYDLTHDIRVDFNYLINLSNNNSFILKEYRDNHDMDLNLATRIDSKYNLYLNHLHTLSWQEQTYDNYKNNLINK